MRPSLPAVFLVFLRLGCTAFGGPVAHLAYFRAEFVERRRWLSDSTFAECMALTQLLPGPASSQTGMLVGWLAAGPLGALCAWTGFTAPSAILMGALGIAFVHLGGTGGAIRGVLDVAVAVVAAAILAMRKTLAPDGPRLVITVLAAAIVLAAPSPAVWPLTVILATVAGVLWLSDVHAVEADGIDLGIPRTAGAILLVIFAICVTASFAVSSSHAQLLALCGTIFFVGSTVFGGGHVVLPLLQATAVAKGLVAQQTLLTGYGAAQAMPGPLFTIASYIGAAAYGGRFGASGAALGTASIFAPSFLLVPGVAPFYTTLAHSRRFRRGLAGANAAVLGILCAAFVTPIFTTAIRGWIDGGIALIAFIALQAAKVPPWAVVLSGAVAGWLLFR